MPACATRFTATALALLFVLPALAEFKAPETEHHDTFNKQPYTRAFAERDADLYRLELDAIRTIETGKEADPAKAKSSDGTMHGWMMISRGNYSYAKSRASWLPAYEKVCEDETLSKLCVCAMWAQLRKECDSITPTEAPCPVGGLYLFGVHYGFETNKRLFKIDSAHGRLNLSGEPLDYAYHATLYGPYAEYKKAYDKYSGYREAYNHALRALQIDDLLAKYKAKAETGGKSEEWLTAHGVELPSLKQAEWERISGTAVFVPPKKGELCGFSPCERLPVAKDFVAPDGDRWPAIVANSAVISQVVGDDGMLLKITTTLLRVRTDGGEPVGTASAFDVYLKGTSTKGLFDGAGLDLKGMVFVGAEPYTYTTAAGAMRTVPQMMMVKKPLPTEAEKKAIQKQEPASGNAKHNSEK